MATVHHTRRDAIEDWLRELVPLTDPALPRTSWATQTARHPVLAAGLRAPAQPR